MIKAKAENVRFLGLSEANIVALKAGMPIKFDGKEIDIPNITFIILYGKTEQDIADSLLGPSYIRSTD